MRSPFTAIIPLLLIMSPELLTAQVIRKNWREMTTHEKEVYVNAINALYDQTPNAIETYVATHNNSTYVRHGQLDFLIWHRMFIYYFEQELKNSGVAGATNIALPYWGWETPGDWTSSSPMFSSGTNNLGLFGLPVPDGTFTRYFGQSSPQPSAAELDNLSTNFTQFGTSVSGQTGTHFWPRLEVVYHNTFHVFIGGVTSGNVLGTMSNVQNSPRDPIFYQHHCYVDKIWQDWHNKNGSSSIANQNVLINTVPGQPQRLRSDIVDSRSLKVWFAYNNQVTLDNYTVTGTENYRYTGTINVGNTNTDVLTVPSSTTCNMVSGTTIVLKPGFHAQNGSAFHATVDPLTNPSSTFHTGRSRTSEEPLAADSEKAREVEPFSADELHVFPNPSNNGRFTVTFLTKAEVRYKYNVLNVVGKPVLSDDRELTNKAFDLTLEDVPPGMYLLVVKMASGETCLKKLIWR